MGTKEGRRIEQRREINMIKENKSTSRYDEHFLLKTFGPTKTITPRDSSDVTLMILTRLRMSHC